MARSIEIPDALFEQASRMAAREEKPVEQLIAEALKEQLEWREFAQSRAGADERRYAGVQERMPDVEFEDEA